MLRSAGADKATADLFQVSDKINLSAEAALRATIEVGDIVQANPETCEWGPALVVVSEVKSFGIQGFTSIPRGGEAYIRLTWADIEPTGGKAVWMPK